MTHDHDVERRLGRYRPAPPPDSLRARIVAAGPAHRPRSARLLWFAAAAALIAAAALHRQASRTFSTLGARADIATERTTAIDDLATLLDGGETGRQVAQELVDASRAPAASPAAPQSGMEMTWIR